MLRTIIFILPVAIHLVLWLITSRELSVGTGLDQAVFLLFVGYLGVGVLLFLRPRLQTKYLLSCYSLLFAAVIAEASLSFFVPRSNQATPWPPMQRTTIAADTMPGIEGPITVTVSSLGIRGPNERSFDQAKIRVLCVGGSTTECLFVTDSESWPWRLQSLLTERVGSQCFVGNAGRSGHFTLHHTYQIRNYSLVSEFDRIVIICGINDMMRFLNGSYSRSKARVANEALTINLSDRVYYRRLRLTEAARMFLWQYVDPIGLMQDASGEWYAKARADRRAAIRESGVRGVPEGLTNAVERYRGDLTELILACRERGVEPVFMTQPTLYKKELSPELDSLLWLTTLEPAAMAQLMDTYNETLREVCKEKGVPCINLAAILPKDTTALYDDCHFNVTGCEKVATILANFFSADLTQPKVIDDEKPKGTPTTSSDGP